MSTQDEDTDPRLRRRHLDHRPRPLRGRLLGRHMMVSKVRGKFNVFSGEIVTGESPLDSSVTATDRPQLDRHRQRRPRQPHPLGRLLRRRHPQDHDVPVDRCPRRRRRLRPRRRADAQGTSPSRSHSTSSSAASAPIPTAAPAPASRPPVSSSAATSASTSTPCSKPAASWSADKVALHLEIEAVLDK